MTLALELGQVSDPSARRAFEQIALRWSSGAAASSPGVVVSSPLTPVLPSAPVDGQEVTFQDTQMSAQGIAWQMRFKAASNQWQFVGGAPYRCKATASYTTAAPNTWETMSAAIFPRWTAPFSGRYRFQFGSRFAVNVLTQTEEYFGLGLSGSGTPFESIRFNTGQVSAGNQLTYLAYEAELALTAGQVVTGMHNTQFAAGNCTYTGQWLWVGPLFSS